jgi:hypothetical protein
MFLHLYFIMTALYLLTFLVHFTVLKEHDLKIAVPATIIDAFLLWYMFSKSGHFPGYTVFESFLFTTFVLSCLAVFFPGINGFGNRVRFWIWLEVLILIVSTMFFSKEITTTGFDYNYLPKVLFMIFRSLSLAAMLYSTAYFTQFIIEREFNERTVWLSHMGRNFLLLSTVFFLVSEYTGIIWCQQEFGDFWMWSQNFIQSTIIMSYLMLAFHIPGKGKKGEDFRALIGGLSGIFVITLTIIRSFF